MKVIVVGCSGTIGKEVTKLLNKHDYDVVGVSRTSTDTNVDICSLDSIRQMYASIGDFDHLISTVGKVTFKSLHEMSENDFMVGIQNKLLGQVNLVQEGIKHISQNGSFTLTTGIINQEPIMYGSSAAMVNSAIEGYVKAASLELREKIRINVVSPSVIEESLPNYAKYFAGFNPVAAADAAKSYLRSVAGIATGKVIKVGF